MSCDDQNSISSADAFLVYDLLGAQVFFLCFVLSEKSDFHLHLGKILFLKRGQNQILQQETTFSIKETLVICKNDEFLHHVLIRI